MFVEYANQLELERTARNLIDLGIGTSAGFNGSEAMQNLQAIANKRIEGDG